MQGKRQKNKSVLAQSTINKFQDVLVQIKSKRLCTAKQSILFSILNHTSKSNFLTRDTFFTKKG